MSKAEPEEDDLDSYVPRDPNQPRWIIDEVLPLRVLALLVGPTGASKTSWMIPTLVHIKNGDSVFGRRVNPTKSVFISCDRSQEEYTSHMNALGVPLDSFPFFDQTHHKTTIGFCIRRCWEKFPDHHLLFIDGFARLVPDGKISDYSIVADFLCQASAAARKYNKTVIGCLHAGKERSGAGYENPRDQVCGSTAWVGFSNLTLVLQRDKPKDPEDPIRKLHVLARGAHGDRTYRYRKLESGILIPEEDPAENDIKSIVELWLSDQYKKNPLRPIPYREIIDQANNCVAERTVKRWIDGFIESGRLERIEKGLYKAISVQ